MAGGAGGVRGVLQVIACMALHGVSSTTHGNCAASSALQRSTVGLISVNFLVIFLVIVAASHTSQQRPAAAACPECSRTKWQEPSSATRLQLQSAPASLGSACTVLPHALLPSARHSSAEDSARQLAMKLRTSEPTRAGTSPPRLGRPLLLPPRPTASGLCH